MAKKSKKKDPRAPRTIRGYALAEDRIRKNVTFTLSPDAIQSLAELEQYVQGNTILDRVRAEIDRRVVAGLDTRTSVLAEEMGLDQSAVSRAKASIHVGHTSAGRRERSAIVERLIIAEHLRVTQK